MAFPTPRAVTRGAECCTDVYLGTGMNMKVINACSLSFRNVKKTLHRVFKVPPKKCGQGARTKSPQQRKQYMCSMGAQDPLGRWEEPNKLGHLTTLVSLASQVSNKAQSLPPQ